MCDCHRNVRYCLCNQQAGDIIFDAGNASSAPVDIPKPRNKDVEPETACEPDLFGRVLLIAEEGSVVHKPAHVDLIEVKKDVRYPIVVSNGGF